MTRLRTLLAALCLPLLACCAHAASMHYPFDTNHSTVGFSAVVLEVSKVTGKFADFEGFILVPDKTDLTTAKVEIKIAAASISTGIPDRDEHLRSEDFFDTAKHPEITFKSARVRRDGERWVVEGSFSMRGVSKEISIPFVLRAHSDVIAAEAHLQLNRKDFGVAWSRTMDDGSAFIEDVVEIDLYLLTRVGSELADGVDPASAGKSESKDPHH